MRVAIGIPSQDMLHTDFAMSLSMIVARAMREHDIEVCLINERSALISKSRSTIVERAFSLEADKLLFLDSDMQFDSDIIKRLLDSGKDIIGCNASTRTEPFRPTVMGLDGKYIASGFEVEEVGYIGTGCLMIDMEVFRKIGMPYFHIQYDQEHGYLGEDYNFCNRVREEGYKVYCDSVASQDVTHLGIARYKL